MNPSRTSTPTTDDPPRSPRVRPIFLLAFLLVVGVFLLRYGARDGWFVGALGAESFARMRYGLWWGGLGLGGGALCTLLWVCLPRRGPRWQLWLGGLLACVLMVGGSQVAGRHAEERVFLVLRNVRWDPAGKELVMQMYGVPGVGRAFRRGDLKISVSYCHEPIEDSPARRLLGRRDLKPGSLPPWPAMVAIVMGPEEVLAHEVDSADLVKICTTRFATDQEDSLALKVHALDWAETADPSTRYQRMSLILLRAEARLLNRHHVPIGRELRWHFVLCPDIKEP